MYARCLREQGGAPPPADEGVRGASLQAGAFAHLATTAMLVATAASRAAVEEGARALVGGGAALLPFVHFPAPPPSADQVGWALLGLQEAAGGASSAAPGPHRAAVARAVAAARRAGGSGASIPRAAVGRAVALG